MGNGEPCADGQPGVRCAGDPCETTICRGHPNENVRCASFVCRVRKLELAHTWIDKVAVYHHLESNVVLKSAAAMGTEFQWQALVQPIHDMVPVLYAPPACRTESCTPNPCNVVLHRTVCHTTVASLAALARCTTSTC